MAISYAMQPDDDFVSRVRAGDEEAFDALVREHYNALCVFASRMMGSNAAAEEIVQDVLLRIWQQRAEWEVRSSVAAYLYGGVRNRSLEYMRRERFFHRWRQQVVESSDPSEGSTRGDEAYQNLRVSELTKALDKAIDELPPRCKQVFVLRRQHHLSTVEVAKAMGIAPKTVEIQVGIALKTLRKKIAHLL